MVADGTSEIFHGVAQNILVTFGEMKAAMNFLAADRAPVGVLIKLSEIETLNAHIDLSFQYVYFNISRKSIPVRLKTVRTINKI